MTDWTQPTPSRRDFLRMGALGATLPSLGPGALASLALPQGSPALVMLQLSGGNDGLATIVPHGDDELYRRRKTTVESKASLLRIDDYRAFHPRLRAFRGEYDAGRMAIVEGCGYPDPIRSHFKSMEIWHTANHAGRLSGEGWIGKLVSHAWGATAAPDSVIHLGGKAPYSVFSSTHPAVAVASPTAYRWFGERAVYEMAGTAICEHEEGPGQGVRPSSSGPEHVGRDRALALLRKTLDDAAESSDRVRRAAATYQTPVEYPSSPLSASLRDVASLISGGVGTRVFSLTYSGFDTHSNQLVGHGRKMAAVDGALGAFLQDLRRTPEGKRAIVVVFSEFGRRVAENGSKGHDHGHAGPMFIFGPAVRGGLYGEHPSLTDLHQGDLVSTVDFRSVYATVIEHWFQADSTAVLGARYPVLDFLAS
ncbi:MAG: DUF1501 domain-containing protein [Planctomycetota bacterium]